jgi:hypothetical protein
VTITVSGAALASQYGDDRTIQTLRTLKSSSTGLDPDKLSIVIFPHASELNRANTLPLYPLFPDVITTKSRSRLKRTAAPPINGSGSCNSIPTFRIVFCSMIKTRATPKLGLAAGM